MALRRRLVALVSAVLLLLAIFVVVLVRSRTPGCEVNVQRPVLPAALRALGDFEQPYDANTPQVLRDAAARAASAQSTSLIGTTPEAPVVVAGGGATPEALVVPLRAPASSGAPTPPIVGLVVFARDCSGNAYLQQVEDDLGRQPTMAAFPPVDRAAAVARLGTAAIRLQYGTSPLQPVWATTVAPFSSVPAR